MKRLCKLAILVAAVMAAPLASDAVEVVKVTDGNGYNAEFVLADIPTVSYTAIGLTITAGSVQAVLPVDATYTCTIGEGAGVINVQATKIEISKTADTVSIYGLEPAAAVSAYTADGRLAAKAIADADGHAVLRLGHAHGVVVVSTPAGSFKLVK